MQLAVIADGQLVNSIAGNGMGFVHYVLLTSIVLSAMLFLDMLGTAVRSLLPLRTQDVIPGDMALGALLCSPAFVMITVTYLSISRLVSSDTTEAMKIADGRGVAQFPPNFFDSIIELDQACSLMIGLLTLAWSAVALSQDRGFLRHRARDYLFSADASPTQSAPPPAGIMPPPAAVIRRRQTNSI